ncbi:MAG: arginine N-succinyltransferase [Planctomycetota bacterium]
MFVIRRARIEDQSTLLKLAKMVHFINLPADKDIIANKVVHSRGSFLRAAGRSDVAPPPKPRPTRGPGAGLGEATQRGDLFMFVLEDTENPGCLGTSQLISQMGGPDDPNVCFKLERRERYSEALKTGVTNVVAKLHLDETGPTEIGGLVLQPSFRGHPLKLGRFVSLVRFHFIGLHRQRFRDRILAEMMAPITTDGQNLLWDHLARRFIPLSYSEADRFCQYSREFVTSLLPHGDIYLSLLPPEARAVVGEVGPETVPARRMLEKLGFLYEDIIDPFDGGPFLHADTDDIAVIRDTKRAKLGKPVPKAKCNHRGIVSALDQDGEFRAVNEPFSLSRGVLSMTKEATAVLGAAVGDQVGVTVLDKPHLTASKKRRTPKKTTKKSTSKK